MQANWIASLLEALEGTGVSPVNPTLLDDLTEAKDAHPKLAKSLETLPGNYSGNRLIAKERLGYFTMAVKEMSS